LSITRRLSRFLDNPAVRVTVRLKPQVDVKAAGQITAIEVGFFTLRGRDGNDYTFQVAPETRFRSPGGVVKGLRDLRLGMRVGVAAHEAGDGQLQVLLVVRGGKTGFEVSGKLEKVDELDDIIKSLPSPIDSPSSPKHHDQ